LARNEYTGQLDAGEELRGEMNAKPYIEENVDRKL
jgi:hypothetical protein